MKLVGAPFTTEERDVVVARTKTAAIRNLRKKQAVTAADDFGAINAYDTLDGKWYCEAMRWYVTVDFRTFTSLKQVGEWWAKWLKKIAKKPGSRR